MPFRRVTSVSTPLLSAIVLSACAAIFAPTQLSAQSKQTKAVAKSAAGLASQTLVGAWSGTATVPLPDSAIVVPVFYTFTQVGAAIAGTAMVPGQGSGPISNVVRSGKQVRFRVTAPEGKLLEHEGAFGADGSIEGMVNLDKQPIAKFKIMPRPAEKAGAKPAKEPKATVKGSATKSAP